MKIKGLKKAKAQITFIGEKHPSSGCMFGFSWSDIKRAIENQLEEGDRVISLQVTEYGIEVFHEKLMTFHEVMALHEKITGWK